jgi:hypothetical protein
MAKVLQLKMRGQHVVVRFNQVENQTLEAFCTRADQAVTDLCGFLKRASKATIDILLVDRFRKSAILRDESAILISKFRLPDRTALVHELTHLIAGKSYCGGDLLEEGLAVYMQERFGGPNDISFPTAGNDLHLEMIRLRRRDICIPPFLSTQIVPNRRRQNDARQAAYIQQGSFVRFLFEGFSREQVMRVYDGEESWSQSFGHSLPELEESWHLHLDRLSSS